MTTQRLEPRDIDMSLDDRAQAARTHLLAAEASDWFWWYGDDFTTDNAAEFDRLFRDRLLRACALVGLAPPPRLLRPLSRQATAQLCNWTMRE
jgi:alpha-amylase/alpha-mannosidase (GH57 family)